MTEQKNTTATKVCNRNSKILNQFKIFCLSSQLREFGTTVVLQGTHTTAVLHLVLLKQTCHCSTWKCLQSSNIFFPSFLSWHVLSVLSLARMEPTAQNFSS